MSILGAIGLNTLGGGWGTAMHVAPQVAVLALHWLKETLANKTAGPRVTAVVGPGLRRLSAAVQSEAPNPPALDLDHLSEAVQAEAPRPPEPNPEQEAQPGVDRWGSLGGIEFQLLSAPEKVSGKEGVKYAQHPVIGAKPHVQWCAPSLRTFSLTIGWHAMLMDDIEGSFEELREAMNAGEPLPLIIGEQRVGSYYDGSFVIQAMPFEVEKYSGDGKILQMTVTLDLLEWNAGAPLEPGEHAPPKAVAKPKKKADPVKTDPTTHAIVPGGKK